MIIPVEELKELKNLLDEGIITQEEFDAKKRQLLGIATLPQEESAKVTPPEEIQSDENLASSELNSLDNDISNPDDVFAENYTSKEKNVEKAIGSIEKSKSPWQQFQTLFYEYYNNHNEAAFDQMQRLPREEIIESYINSVESFAFGLAHGWNYSPEAFDNPFKNFCDHNFGKFKDEVFKGYKDLDKGIRKCADAFVQSYEALYPQKLANIDVKNSIVNHTIEIVSFFILYHGYNASETVQGGVASYLGFKMRFNNFNSIAKGYLWMFEENPDYYLDDFLEIYNTRVMNYLVKDVMFKTKPYDELVPLSELEFPEEIEKKEHEAIAELTKYILNNELIVSSIYRNSDGHFVSMLKDRLNNGRTSNDNTAIAITQKLLEDKNSRTIMDYRGGFPHVPELMVQADIVCSDLFTNLQNEIDNPSTFLTLTPMWCAYAGMGAVALWNDNWPGLRDNGIIPSLIKERGYFAMDEYVMDYIGVGWDSEECKKVNSILHAFSVMLVAESIENKEINMHQYSEVLKGMYYYGIVYEMSRLGMH